ncbi:MAG TPA: 4Fe-4S dicluster domain-containing protein [Bacillota bacterium]|nr:4Fe-4S dicluster domain-containing protein [Bacillota bacterium]
MNAVKFSKTQLVQILGKISSEYRLVGPVLEDGILVFKEIERIEDLVIHDALPYKSPKELLFPRVEQILAFDEQGGISGDEPGPPTVIFGVKPCDLEALQIMRAIFTQGKFQDLYFQRRWERTILIGQSCLKEKPGCFCKQRGLDPGYSSAADIFVSQDGGTYRGELLTERGQNLFKGYELETAPERVKAAQKPLEPILELKGSEKELFEQVNWEAIAEKCLGCGVCTVLCPTCHCFEFKDVSEGGINYRYRCWDSCMFPKFTLHASGHNPRATKKERIRQRVLHKYHYLKQNTGFTGCTGCGRCLRSCPAGMNIKAIVTKIMEEIR